MAYFKLIKMRLQELSDPNVANIIRPSLNDSDLYNLADRNLNFKLLMVCNPHSILSSGSLSLQNNNSKLYIALKTRKNSNSTMYGHKNAFFRVGIRLNVD